MKEKALNEKMLELSKIMEVYNTELQRCQEMKNAQNNYTNQLANLCQEEKELDISRIQSHRSYLDKTVIDIMNQEQVLQGIKRLVNEKQEEVNQALKEKKIFEKLKEKEQEKYYKEFRMLEQIELDDIAISCYAQK